MKVFIISERDASHEKERTLESGNYSNNFRRYCFVISTGTTINVCVLLENNSCIESVNCDIKRIKAALAVLYLIKHTSDCLAKENCESEPYQRTSQPLAAITIFILLLSVT